MLELIHSAVRLPGFAGDVTVRYENNFPAEAAGRKTEECKDISLSVKLKWMLRRLHHAPIRGAPLVETISGGGGGLEAARK